MDAIRHVVGRWSFATLILANDQRPTADQASCKEKKVTDREQYTPDPASRAEDNPERRPRRFRSLHFFAGLLILCVVVMCVLILFPWLPDPTCVSLIMRSEKEVAIPLPPNCAQAPTVDSDTAAQYLEDERNSRGLAFRQWIICKGTPTRDFAFIDDPHWLPSYVPGTYQYRRTVIVVPYAQQIPKGSAVVGEVCLMPWRKYIRQIAGQCDGKFSVWK